MKDSFAVCSILIDFFLNQHFAHVIPLTCGLLCYFMRSQLQILLRFLSVYYVESLLYWSFQVCLCLSTFDYDEFWYRSHHVCSMLRFWASWMCRLIFFIRFIKFAPVIALMFYYLLVFGRAGSFVSVCGLSLVVAHGASQQVASLVASTGGRRWLQWLQRVRLRPQ